MNEKQKKYLEQLINRDFHTTSFWEEKARKEIIQLCRTLGLNKLAKELKSYL